MTSVVIIGGGPGGYEAALVAAQLGGSVTLVEKSDAGGAAVLTDCVPSKTLIATAEAMTSVAAAGELGLVLPGANELHEAVTVDLGCVNRRVLALAAQQSLDIRASLIAAGVRIITGTGSLESESQVKVEGSQPELLDADVILVATGTRPRELPTAKPDGERILNWTQLYDLETLPEHLIVVGSGVTGAEFASAYDALGSQVTLVSSRDQVLPGHDPNAAAVLQGVFERRGMKVHSQARAQAAERRGDVVVVTLADGTQIEGSHCLIAVGSIPNTANIGLDQAGVRLNDSGHIIVDRVSRTTNRNIYAAGDCTGVFALASVAAMQGRIAMWHTFGEAVTPLNLREVSSNVFTSPEIATVGVTHADIEAGVENADSLLLPLATNARAKMQGLRDGFVKLYCRPHTGIIIGGVVVAPHASELIHPISLAVKTRLSVDEFATTFTVYPSLSGSVAEAARQMLQRAQ